jgi:hypothetical protein
VRDAEGAACEMQKGAVAVFSYEADAWFGKCAGGLGLGSARGRSRLLPFS